MIGAVSVQVPLRFFHGLVPGDLWEALFCGVWFLSGGWDEWGLGWDGTIRMIS